MGPPKTFLAQTHPHLRDEFLYVLDKNGQKDESKTFNTVGTSSRLYAMWKCPRTNCETGCEHIYKARISNRTKAKPSGCPMCSLPPKKICPCNSLAGKRPDLISEWDVERNGDVLPTQVAVSSDAKRYWTCSKTTCGHHKWEASPHSRTGMNSGCPFCKSHRFCPCYNLATEHRDLIDKEWDSKMNTDLDPTTLAPTSRNFAWWIGNPCKHSWRAVIGNRTIRGSGCPKCRQSKMEKVMLAILQVMTTNKQIKEYDYQWQIPTTRFSIDFRITCLNGSIVALEMDGEQHFEPVAFGSSKDPEEMFLNVVRRDSEKNDWCVKNKFRLLRISYQIHKDTYDTVLTDFLNSSEPFMLLYDKPLLP